MDRADTIYLTRIHAQVEGDVFFPEIDETVWDLVESKDHPADEKHKFSFTFQTYRKTSSLALK